MDYQTLRKICLYDTKLANILAQKLGIYIPEYKSNISPKFQSLVSRYVVASSVKADVKSILLEMDQAASSFSELLYLHSINLRLKNSPLNNLPQKMADLSKSIDEKLLVLTAIAPLEPETEKKLKEEIVQTITLDDCIIKLVWDSDDISPDNFNFLTDQMVRLLQQEISREKPVATPSPNRILPDGQFYEENIISP